MPLMGCLGCQQGWDGQKANFEIRAKNRNFKKQTWPFCGHRDSPLEILGVYVPSLMTVAVIVITAKI